MQCYGEIETVHVSVKNNFLGEATLIEKVQFSVPLKALGEGVEKLIVIISSTFKFILYSRFFTTVVLFNTHNNPLRKDIKSE